MAKTATFADRLRNLREMSGLTQAELGEKSKINSTQIAHFENGGREPNLENLVKIVKALGISADVLLGTART
jgi:transcriptional regulator with XRE-family HTH domain